MKNRVLLNAVRKRKDQKTGRLIVLTGGRQTGKTTLALRFQNEYEYISLEDPVTRPAYSRLTAGQWSARFPAAILDEIQKVPHLIESIKAVYDRSPKAKYILLGSSQILLLNQIKESLAGRASIFELYPLTLPESATSDWDEPIISSRLVQYLTGKLTINAVISGTPLLDERYIAADQVFGRYLEVGSMPTMFDDELDRDERSDWLSDFTRTYLQRDIGDLASLRDLEPFVAAQKNAALLTAQLVNFSSLASLSGVSSNTAKRFLSYLELSYQTFLLRPWHRNEKKRLSKSSKLHFIDPGILRNIAGHAGPLNGHEFESAVASEIYKQFKTWRLPVGLYHLRSLDGREVDLLLECETGFIPIEIKQTSNVRNVDARNLRGLEQILDKPILHSFVLSNDREIRSLGAGITAVPVPWLLG